MIKKLKAHVTKEGLQMLQLQRPNIGSEITLRLVHDISPESSDSTEEEDDESITLRRERFLISCLAQSAINSNNNNSISYVSQTTCDRFCDKAETITETYAKLESRQNHFERINNHINEQHLFNGTDALNQNINLINNNFLQLQENEFAHQSSKHNNENEQPTSPVCKTKIQSTEVARRPRKLPDFPKLVPACSAPLKLKVIANDRCLADELRDALVQKEFTEDCDDDVFESASDNQLQKVYPKYSRKFLEELKTVKFNSVSKNTRAYLNSDNIYLQEDSTNHECYGDQQNDRVSTDDHKTNNESMVLSIASGGKGSNNGEGSRRQSTSYPCANDKELEVTHRGMHRFIPRHKDEMSIEIGDPIHVAKTSDDLWCEGFNLRTYQQGIFPSMYATDLAFLEEEEEENGCSKFLLRFLGSVEVNYHNGDEVLCQAINKVALSCREIKSSIPPPVCNLEISQYGVRMFDKSKKGQENLDTCTHFFALKNITFCGHHPRNERYFGFITKHPNQYRYACHVFLGEKSTRLVTDAIGQAFKRFYQEYMALTHPTEDIYME